MKVRFAPSPTGVLHIGGARTALYNWLLARGQGGEFALRIEDTDRERSTPENVEQILDAMRWLELDFDEGPISQAERAPAHTAAIDKLLADGHAYEDDGAVRLRVPDEGETVVHDQIRGEIATPNQAIQDFVIRRSDGSALYNLAVAVDDRDMGITHVVRGEDHISNTPRQVMILRALGEEPPAYAHLPLLHGPDGKKLSKRHGAASVQELRAAGYLPEAVRNYIALLGWGYDESTTFFTTDELIERFDLSRVSKNPAVFDEQKLRWMNGRYLRELPAADLKRPRAADRPGAAARGRRDQPGQDADAGRLLAAGRLPRRAARDRRAGLGEGDAQRRRRAAPGRPRRPRAGRVVRHRGGRASAARRGRSARRQAEGRFPADPRGDRRNDRLAGHLRVGRRAGPRRDASRIDSALQKASGS